MKKVIMCKGLPGSGKSTWAKSKLRENPNQYKRINKDDLRAMLDDSQHSNASEKFIQKVRDALIIEALKNGCHVIVDDTNFAPKHEARIRQLVTDFNRQNNDSVSVEVKFFEATVEECIARDLNRPKSVGERVIRSMYRDYLAPKPPVIERNPNLPDAIICDLDGTLALLNGRSPYDASTCESDLLNEAVAQILRKSGDAIIFMSGRMDKHREQTQAWLKAHRFYYEALHMRATGDTRKDSIIKQELYDRYVKGKYNILFVLDDRNQVVEFWRSIGLTCLQVADGDF